MRYIKRYEFMNKDIPNFAIDIGGAKEDDLMKVLDLLESYFGELNFNPSPSDKEDFIRYSDIHSKNGTWCWLVEKMFRSVRVGGVHTRGWYREDLMEHMIYWKTFLRLGVDDSIIYMKKEIEERQIKKDAARYNL